MFEVWVLLPLVLAAPPQVVFVLLYGLPWLGAGQWWRDDVGRALFFKSATFALVLSTLAVRITHNVATSPYVQISWGAPDRWVDWLGAVLYWLAFFAICYQLKVLVRRRVRERVRT